MKDIKILCVGKIKEKYFREGIEYYVRQIKKKYPVEVVECADEATPDKASETEELQIKDKEDYVIALCIDGVHNSSLRWRERMQKRARLVSGSMVFVIGGSLGLSDAVVRRANEKLSFSAMTFPHQMMRMILCEQIAGVFAE